MISQIARYIENGTIRRFIVIAGEDGRDERRAYYTELAKALPPDNESSGQSSDQNKLNR